MRDSPRSVPPAPDAWLVLEVQKPREEDLAGLLVDDLMSLTSRGVEERDDSFLVYLSETVESPEPFVEELRDRLAASTGLVSPAISFRWQLHEDWEQTWKEGLVTRRITPRLVVSPTWEEPSLEPGERLISINPGMAFGTAEHPTTRGCLRLLDECVEPGDRVADIGAGSAILSIAAAVLGAERVLAVEMDPWSCATARENVTMNGVADRVEVREGVVGPDFLPEEATLDGIVANIESRVLLPLLDGFRSGLREGGWLILSGILEHEVPEVMERASTSEFAPHGEVREDGWWTGGFRAVPARDR